MSMVGDEPRTHLPPSIAGSIFVAKRGMRRLALLLINQKLPHQATCDCS